MKIAVLGWGSLIWDPRDLRIKGEWNSDGPYLPVEFARISSHGKSDETLTLVIFPESGRVQVLWAWMDTEDLDEAIENLRQRERRTPRSNIGYLIPSSDELHSRFGGEITGEIRDWARQKKNVEAVIWTDLPTNFQEITGNEFNKENVLQYLEKLPGEKKRRSEEYIRKAPPQIKTEIRRFIEEKLGWTSRDT